MLEEFEKIDYNIKLIEFCHVQSMHKPLPTGYTKMRAVFEKEYSEFTLEECTKLNKHVLSAFGNTMVRPPFYEESNSIQMTWYIPTEAAIGLLGKAYQVKELFQLLPISHFEIGGAIIFNKKWPDSPDVCGHIIV